MNILTSLCDRADSAPDNVSLTPSGELLTATPLEKLGVFLGIFVPITALLIGIILAWGRGVNALDLALLGGMYALTVIGITVGYHRLLTHRAFETYPIIRFLLASAGSMSLQGPVLQWCAVHRRHHQQSDRAGDPHSPHQHGSGFFAFVGGMWHSHVGWLFEPMHTGMERSIPDLMNDRAVVAADRWFWVSVVIGLTIPTAIGGVITHSWHGALGGLFWGGLVRMCLMHHATFSINSVCHIWGSRPYQSSDESRNNPIFGVVSFGEGWHNNHHAFPTSARHGLAWWQLDISWLFIWALSATKLAWNVRLPSRAALAAKTRRPQAEKTSTRAAAKHDSTAISPSEPVSTAASLFRGAPSGGAELG